MKLSTLILVFLVILSRKIVLSMDVNFCFHLNQFYTDSLKYKHVAKMLVVEKKMYASAQIIKT